MGCSLSKDEKIHPQIAQNSINGVLRLTIEEADIKNQSRLFSIDPYIRLVMSNQQYQGYIHAKPNRTGIFNKSFQFIINSCYKSEGRSLCIQVKDESFFGDKVLGIGIIDLEPILNFDQKKFSSSRVVLVSKQNNGRKQPQQELKQQDELRTSQCRMKVFLNSGVKQIGYLNTLFCFVEQKVVVVGFKFLYASLRRGSSIFTMDIRIQVTAGEQILSTKKQNDKGTKNPPSWQNQILLFNIPFSLKQCLIRVLDDDRQVGKLIFSFGEVIQKKGEYQFSEQLEHHNIMVGVVRFVLLVGVDSVKNEAKEILKLEQFNISPQLQEPLSTMKKEEPEERPQRQQQKIKNPELQAKTAYNTNANQEEYSRTHKFQNSDVIVKQGDPKL